ncbi:MAG TPA: hypothetical protein VFG19_13415 [Geobacteraceae bacterium]|nr:hypothetical protein [Geobacteraceae bacterium]
MKIIFTLLFIFLTGCAGMGGMFEDVKIENALKAGHIYIGSDMDQVAGVTGWPPSSCRKTKITENGNIELWDFASGSCAANLAHCYALIFKDGKLSEIRKVNTRLDMQL